MDPITISMLEMGLSLTGMVFKLLRQTSVGAGTHLQPHVMPEVRQFIQESARRMETTIHAAVLKILDKLEQDHFELLLSRTRNLLIRR